MRRPRKNCKMEGGKKSVEDNSLMFCSSARMCAVLNKYNYAGLTDKGGVCARMCVSVVVCVCMCELELVE